MSQFVLERHAAEVLPGSQRPHLRALTSLRIFAALHVVGRHFANALLERDASRWAHRAEETPTLINQGIAFALRMLHHVTDCGAASVSLFFVLSGFILAYTYLDADHPRPTSRRDFWSARFARVYPVFLLGWIIAAPSAGLHLLAPETPRVEQILLPFMSLFATQAWVPYWGLHWNAPAWSLCIEALFYALFPVLFRLGTPASRSKLAFWLSLAVAIPSLYWLIDPDHLTRSGIRAIEQLPLDNSAPWMLAISLHPVLRLPELLAGVWLGKIFLDQLRRGRRAPPWLTPLAIVLILVAFCVRPYVPVMYYTTGGIAPLFALLIYALAFGGGVARLISVGWLVLLGEASYAIYILHVPIAGFFHLVMVRLRPAWFAGTSGELQRSPTWTYFWLFTGMMLIVGVLSFWYFETPMRYWIRRRLAGHAAWARNGGQLTSPPAPPG